MSNPIDAIKTTCIELIEALEQDSCPDLNKFAISFSKAVDRAMEAYNAGQISVDMSTLPRVMHQFATEELPKLCAGNSDDRRIARKQCKLFLVTMEELVQPETK
ncbi:MAG: hypothetical protein BAJATHORv1_30099 [Candidatus Thorarchaeota archaeon]|nr:MAG: hypothetical protein BAJATHORv1_30099 [Candidatus Thorarchaeota archaeon]